MDFRLLNTACVASGEDASLASSLKKIYRYKLKVGLVQLGEFFGCTKGREVGFPNLQNIICSMGNESVRLLNCNVIIYETLSAFHASSKNDSFPPLSHFGPRLDTSSCPLHTGTPQLASTVPREKNFILLDSQSCWH